MFDLFLADGCQPFSIALVIMLCIAVIELLTSGIASAALDSILPDFDGLDSLDTVDGIDAADTADVDVPAMTKLLGFIRVKGVPMLIVLVAFLTVFSLTGFILQTVVESMTTKYLPYMIAIWPTLLITVPAVKLFSGLLEKVVIRDETEAVSSDSFVTCVAVLIEATAKVGCPAEALLEDKYGHHHYVRVEPKEEGVEFSKGDKVVLVKKEGYIFKVVAYKE